MSDKIYSTKLQDKTERNIFVMVILVMIVLSVGGLVEITPLFYLDETMEHNKHPQIVWDRKEGQKLSDWKAGDGVRPYTALEFAGRDIYVREGCYLCHSQMIRPFRDEKERYGHYSLATESMYDHPFQWGSKRTGPDLARVGGKYSNEWHVEHLMAPRKVVPESVMPNYPFLATKKVNFEQTYKGMQAMQFLNTPYTDADIETAKDIKDKTELEAVIAYLQVLGTMVTFEEGVDYRE